MDLTGGFKIADDSSSWDTQFIAETGGALAAPMTVGTVYDAFARFAGDGTDPGNNTIALDSSSNYLFAAGHHSDHERTGSKAPLMSAS